MATLDEADNISYYHTDHLGTPQEVTNTEGEVVWEAEYTTWGNTAKVSYKQTQSTINPEDEVALQPLRFQGQYYDKETGLHYNRFRYYDPDIGRFTTQDPIGLLGGDNLYMYAPNPVAWVDPLGLSCIKKHPSKKAARRAAQRDAGMGKHGGVKKLPDQKLHPGSQSPQGDRGVRTEIQSTDTGKIVHHDPYGHIDDNIPPHYGVEDSCGKTIHHTYPSDHNPMNNR